MIMKRTNSGMTLIELMIAVVIVAILSVIAITLYSSQFRAGRRTDAINTIYSISLAEERYRTTNTTYGSLTQVWGGVTTSTGGYYTLSISNTSATAYTITATATGDQIHDAEGATSCTPLQLAMSNGTFTKTPAVCWPS
jgi:type IV pilus assembly protein PilE